MSTTSPPSVLLGVQRPRVLSRPEWVSSAGVEAVELAASAGLVLDEWQAFALEVILAERSDGRWAAFESGVLVARQNGKGAIIEALELAGLFLFGERLILHSAHEFKTAAEGFLRIKELVEGSDELRRLCKKPRTSHGEESIERLDGARLRFVARSRSSGRGFSGDRVILDEAQELPRKAVGAMLPTLSARPNPQVNYFGTVPDEENQSEQWVSLRDRGRLGGDPSLAWLEWSFADSPAGVDLDDREAWLAGNPAMGIRVPLEHVERERASLADDDFARERLSLWGTVAAQQVVDLERWSALADEAPPKVSRPALAVDVTPDRSKASVAWCGVRPDGRRHVEVVRNAAGTGWVVAELVERASQRGAPVVLDASGPAGSLIPALSEAGVEPVVVSAREMAQACGQLFDAVVDGSVSHFDQPALNVALAAARKRPLGDAWAWHRKDASADISPLVAVTLALWGQSRQKRAPSGRAVFV